MKPTLAFPIPEVTEFAIDEITGTSEKYLDIPYAKESECQIMDIYLPEKKKEKYPLILYIHEGAFMFGSKRDKRMQTLFEALNRGFAIASMDYRKADQVTWPAPVYDVKAAIRFLKAGAKKYHLDPDRFTVWGMSAGAYYAAMAAVTNGNPGFEDPDMGYSEYSSDVQAVVDLCGACSGFQNIDDALKENGAIRANHNEANSPESILMGAPLQKIRELCRMASPITYLGKDAPFFFIMHCTEDPVVPVQQSRLFEEAIAARAGREKVMAVYREKAADHAKPDYGTQEIVDMALSFLERVLSME